MVRNVEIYVILYHKNVLSSTKLIRANQIGCHCCGRRSDSSAQVLRNSSPGHPPPSVTTPAEMNWPAEFLDDLAGVCIIIIERNRLRANKMRKLSLLLRPARWYVFS